MWHSFAFLLLEENRVVWDGSLSLVGGSCVVLQKVILEGREEEDGFYAPAGVANLERERERVGKCHEVYVGRWVLEGMFL